MSSKKRDGIVYSTDPNFRYNDARENEQITLPPDQQILRIWIDSKGRNGKTVTLVKGFQGNHNDLEDLGAALKRHCGTGGTVKEGDIILQGNFRDKVLTFLLGKGYKAKKAGG